jgi:transposase
MSPEVKAPKRNRRSPEKIVELVMEAERTGNASAICRREGVSPQLFYRWKNQFKMAAIQGMKEMSKRGRKPAVSPESQELRNENAELKEALVRSSIELSLLKKSVSSR